MSCARKVWVAKSYADCRFFLENERDLCSRNCILIAASCRTSRRGKRRHSGMQGMLERSKCSDKQGVVLIHCVVQKKVDWTVSCFVLVLPWVYIVLSCLVSSCIVPVPVPIPSYPCPHPFLSLSFMSLPVPVLSSLVLSWSCLSLVSSRLFASRLGLVLVSSWSRLVLSCLVLTRTIKEQNYFFCCLSKSTIRLYFSIPKKNNFQSNKIIRPEKKVLVQKYLIKIISSLLKFAQKNFIVFR